jgi:two-component system, LytTR family, sensor kinase
MQSGKPSATRRSKPKSAPGDMTPSPLIRRAWTRWLLLVAFWTAIGLSFAAQFYISSRRLGRPVSWWFAASYALFDWYVFALLSIPVVWLSRRYPVRGANWEIHVPLHLVASGAFAILFVVLRAWVAVAQGWFTQEPAAFSQGMQALPLKFFPNLLIYWVILTVSHAVNYYREAQDRQLRTSELERHLAQARLQALQMQLNPHFLFNTLHAISALMHKDVEAADRMIARLSDLLRYALESTNSQEVPLKQELAFLERYLEIEQTRFGDRLVVQKQIDPTALDVQVPNLILQPLVENAIRHGIEPHARRGEITLSAHRGQGLLHLEVRDNGEGLVSANGSPDEGVGLSNTRARLAELYGEEYRFEFRNADEGGLIVHLAIPCRVENQPVCLQELGPMN